MKGAKGMAAEEERILTGQRRVEDDAHEQSLRPSRLASYIGQERIKESLSIFIQAALERADALDHVLLHGPPGLGKTTLAGVIANELGVNMRTTSGPAIERQGDLIAILTNLEPRDVLFIDEIHRLNRTVEEVLYPALEDFAVDIVIGKGPSARSLRLDLPPFTLIGATTRAGMLSSPLRDRFGALFRLEYYTQADLQAIITRAADVLAVAVEEDGAKEVAGRSRGTPRIANRLLKRVRDFAQVRADGTVTGEVAREALALLDIDALGLDRTDRELLRTIIDVFDGGPVGVETLAAAAGEEVDTIEDVYEPYLMQLGYLERTPRGRRATVLAYRHLNKPEPTTDESSSPDGGNVTPHAGEKGGPLFDDG